MLRVGIVGMGGIGQTHARVYNTNGQAELVAVCDIDGERARQAAARFGATPYADLTAMLDGEQLDLVSVCTSGEDNGGDHFAPVMAALEHGVHVLCEKPLSNDVEKAATMVAAARQRGLYLATNLNHRFVPLASRAKGLLDDGALGTPLLINMVLWINNTIELQENPRPWTPYFHIRALHPHSIDVMRYFAGADVTRVQAFLTRAPGRQIWSTVQLNLEFANGIVGHLTGSYDAAFQHGIERCEVMGDRGRFVLENVNDSLRFYPKEEAHHTVWRGKQGFNDTFPNRINHLIEEIVRSVSPEAIAASGEDGLKAQRVLEAAIRSHEEGTVVSL